jgi:hypothetical protein
MCTLSFLPEDEGYVVAMNRDELKLREQAIGPGIYGVGPVRAVYPQEASGGTWISATSRGNLLAVLNWNLTNGSQFREKPKSRGEIIPSLLGEESPEQIDRYLRNQNLTRTLPFRLVGLFAQQREIREWRWDGERVNSRWHEWVRGHWFSSSRSDDRAEATRRKTCEMMWQEGSQRAKEWLRHLHASHLPEAGAFSICVHREDAATVSLTEVRCNRMEIEMTYVAGNPCAPVGGPSVIRLPIVVPTVLVQPKYTG